MAANLPDQAQWPDILFRVTSSLTWRRTSTPFEFISPGQQLFQHSELTLGQAFPFRSHFDDAVARHLKASHVLETGAVFHTPFISTTTSFRYALSVAELQFRRGGEDVAITIIDTTLIEHKGPIWDAQQIAKLIHLSSSKGDFRDEFLVFGYLKASKDAAKSTEYLDLCYKLGSFIPALFDKQESSRSRFSTFWKGLPKKNTPFTPSEAAAAFQIARYLATRRTMIPLMIMVLCVQDRNTWSVTFVEEIVALVCVSTQLRKEDFNGYFRHLFVASYTETTARGSTEKLMSVYDFLDAQNPPVQATATEEVKCLNRCVVSLRKKLHELQAAKIKKRFDLSPTALVVRQFTRGDADEVIKRTDRNTANYGQLLIELKGGWGLSVLSNGFAWKSRHASSILSHD